MCSIPSGLNFDWYFSLVSLTDFISPCIQLLIRNRATDLEARMDDGTTPLILAARHHLLNLVRYLIKAGVKVNIADNQGEFLTPFFGFWNRIDLNVGIEFWQLWMFPIGKTALHWAASVNGLDVTKELLRNGAKNDVQDEKVCRIQIYFSCELCSQ